MLKPNDSEVVVEETIGGGDEVQPPPGTSLIDWRLQAGLGAFIVQVEDSAAHLTHSKDWITSSVTLSVITPLRQLDPPLSSGARIQIEQDGGTMNIGPTKVTAVRKKLKPLQVGEKYLLFLDRSKEGDLNFLPQAAYRIVGSDDLEMVSQRVPRDEIANAGLGKATQSIQNWITARPR